MTPLLAILGVWRRRAPWLGAGLVLSLAAVAAGAGLLAVSGAALVHRTTSELAGLAVLGIGLPVAVRLLGVSRTVLRYLERLVTHAATLRALADLRVWLFRGMTAGAAGGLGYRRSGDLISRLVSDVEALDGLYLRILVPGAAGVLLLPVLVAVLLPLGLGAVLTVGGLFVLAAFVLPALAARAALARGARLAAAHAALRIGVLDAVGHLPEVRAFGAEDRMSAAVRLREDELTAAQRDLSTAAAAMDAAALLCGQVGVLLVLVSTGGIGLGAVVAAFLAVAAFDAVSGLPRAGVLFGHAVAAASRVAEAGQAAPPAVPTRARLPADASLRFEGVSARWQADGVPVLQDVSFDIPAGSRVALLGPSGSGKSTVAALAMQVLRPGAGRILLGGVDIAELPPTELRRRVALLSQATHVFDDTIRGNLLLGRADAEEHALWAALDGAALGDMVRALPDGLDTWIGENGARLSGGQARRLALARALLSRASVLILDEPAAGLDADTERAFLSSLFGAAQDRTLILIAHRLTGVERPDRIWRLSAGHAVAAMA